MPKIWKKTYFQAGSIQETFFIQVFDHIIDLKLSNLLLWKLFFLNVFNMFL